MSSWTVTYLDEALKDINRLDGSAKQQVAKAIKSARIHFQNVKAAMVWSLETKQGMTCPIV